MTTNKSFLETVMDASKAAPEGPTPFSRDKFMRGETSLVKPEKPLMPLPATVEHLLRNLVPDFGREGLEETPIRVAKAWQFWTKGYQEDPAAIMKVFEDGAEDCDEMVLVKNIPFYSHCEHHLAPIIGKAHVAYIPNGKIVGLSKLNRVVDVFARRLQVQERLTNQIADAIVDNLNAQGVGVIIEARHMCMESRGVCQQGHTTITSALRGVMRTDPATRAEFMSLANK